MTYNGIMRTTNVTVQYNNETNHGNRRSNSDRDLKADLGLRTSISDSL